MKRLSRWELTREAGYQAITYASQDINDRRACVTAWARYETLCRFRDTPDAIREAK